MQSLSKFFFFLPTDTQLNSLKTQFQFLIYIKTDINVNLKL